MVKKVVEKVVFLILVIVFTLTGFAMGYEKVLIYSNLNQQLNLSLIIFITLLAMIMGILLSPLIIRKVMKIIELLINKKRYDENEIRILSSSINTKLIFKFKKNYLQILQWRPLNIVIDNEKTIKVPWFKNIPHEIKPGYHKIQISIPFLGSEIGVTNIEFDINEHETMEIIYKPPLTVFGPGTILPRKVK